jgi:hypothetical protein
MNGTSAELVADGPSTATCKDRRAAHEPCTVVLAVGRDGATDGGSHDPSKVEPQVVAMKKLGPGKTPKGAVSEKYGPDSCQEHEQDKSHTFELSQRLRSRGRSHSRDSLLQKRQRH